MRSLIQHRPRMGLLQNQPPKGIVAKTTDFPACNSSEKVTEPAAKGHLAKGIRALYKLAKVAKYFEFPLLRKFAKEAPLPYFCSPARQGGLPFSRP